MGGDFIAKAAMHIMASMYAGKPGIYDEAFVKKYAKEAVRAAIALEDALNNWMQRETF